MRKLTTRGPVTAQAIADREDFTTHGALAGLNVSGLTSWDSGRLSGPDLEKFQADRATIDYVVTSYATPIAWHTPDGWHRVSQKFSVTTSHHQGVLYRIGV